MSESRAYRTKQRELIVGCLVENKERHITADEIVQLLRERSEPVGKATVYRLLDKLVGEGAVRKYIAEEGKSACYQYSDGSDSCNRHFHLKCVRCNRLFHVECDYLSELDGHILAHHGFTVDNTKTVLYGICRECGGNE